MGQLDQRTDHIGERQRRRMTTGEEHSPGSRKRVRASQVNDAAVTGDSGNHGEAEA